MSDDIQRPESRAELFNILRGLIKRANSEGLNANETLQRAVDLGLGIQRKQFLDLRRDTLGPFRFRRQIEQLGDQRIVPASYHHQSTQTQLRGNFLYTFEVRVFDLETRTFENKGWSLSANQQMDIESMKATVSSLANSDRPGSQWQVVDITLVGAQAKPGVFGQ